MKKEKIRKLIGLTISFLIIYSCFTAPVQSFFSIPSQQRLTVGDPLKIKLNFPQQVLKNLSLYVKGEKSIFRVNGAELEQPMMGSSTVVPTAAQPGIATVQLRLFGLIPIRSMTVEVYPQLSVVPGGQSIGVILHSQGALVVGQSVVEDINGNKSNPAKEAGISVGDIILNINGQQVKSDDQVSKIINQVGEKGETLSIEVKHKDIKSIKKLKPVKCKDTNRYRIGLYIRDSAAGVGTLTFYEPTTKKYGALGHIITDADTNQPIEIANGKIVKSLVQGIERGKKGRPGEKVGMFIDESKKLGNIEENTNFGIFGTAKGDIVNPISKELPVALADQIKEGPAQILTVIDGDKIEKFDIEIQRIQKQIRPDTKGLIIKVTDSELLSRTGGIIQGMSGSPIIQDNKIVGAVTHVFVNDPTRGYGILIEWMLRESDVLKDKIKLIGAVEGQPSFFYFPRAIEKSQC